MISVLDHGYVKPVDIMGTEERIIESARMSTGRGFESWENDERLLKYLWRNEHHTPFEMCDLLLEVQAPIFVARQWMRHRSFSYNELSARYTEMPETAFRPISYRKQSTKNKQGSDGVLTGEGAALADEAYTKSIQKSMQAYRNLLSLGVSRELARSVLPTAMYTRFRAKGNLRNWLHFVDLRIDEHAQYEIQVYANAIGQIIGEAWPKTWALFNQSRFVNERVTRMERVLASLRKPHSQECQDTQRYAQDGGLSCTCGAIEYNRIINEALI